MKTFMKTTKIILNISMTIIIIFGVIFVGLYICGIQPYAVKSGSMEPDIETGSISFINKKIAYEEIHEGDIIAFKINSGSFATHRVVQITSEGMTTKGDANSTIDNIIITKDNFIGKNIFSIPRIGFIIETIQSPKGKIILGTVIIFLFIAGILIGEPSKKIKQKQKNNESVKNTEENVK